MALGIAVIISACSPQTTAMNEATDGSNYEAITIGGSSKVADCLVRINRRTGETWVHTRGRSNDRMYLVSDANGLLKGHYKLYGWSEVEPNQDAYFNVYRMNENTGQVWTLVVMSEEMYRWKDIGSYVARE